MKPPSPIDLAYDGVASAFREALRQVEECDVPDVEHRLAQVVILCDTMKTAALAKASAQGYARARATKDAPE